MKLPPLLNQAKRSCVDLSNDFSGVYFDRNFLPLILCVEMWRRVIQPIHVDYDPEESTQNRHLPFPCPKPTLLSDGNSAEQRLI